MPNNKPKPHLTNTALPCPRCQANQGYMQQQGYYKDFFCPVCMYQCPAKHYRTRQREATSGTMIATIVTEQGKLISFDNQNTSEEISKKLKGKKIKKTFFTEWRNEETTTSIQPHDQPTSAS